MRDHMCWRQEVKAPTPLTVDNCWTTVSSPDGSSRGGASSRKCVSQTSELIGSSVAAFTGDQSSLSLLQAMLAQMKADLDTLGPDGDGPAASATGSGKGGLSGFSVALVSTLARLVHLFKQVDIQLESLQRFCPSELADGCVDHRRRRRLAPRPRRREGWRRSSESSEGSSTPSALRPWRSGRK